MNDADVKFIELRCPLCGQLLMRVAGIGCVIEIKCWRNGCSKPLLRYPAQNFEIVRREQIKSSGVLSTALT